MHHIHHLLPHKSKHNHSTIWLLKLWHDEKILKLCIQYILYELFISLIWYQVILGQDDELLLSDSGYVAKHIWWLIPTSRKIWDIGRDTTQPYAVHGYLQSRQTESSRGSSPALQLFCGQTKEEYASMLYLAWFWIVLAPCDITLSHSALMIYDSRTGHPEDCRSSQQQRLSLQKVHCRAVFRLLNYSCEYIYQWQNKHVFIYLYIQN